MLDFRKKEHLQKILLALVKILHADKFSILAEIIKNSRVSINQLDPGDNWNDNANYYAFYFDIEIDEFVEIRDSLAKYEDILLKRIQSICPSLEYDIISSAKISIVSDSDDETPGSGLSHDQSIQKFEEPTFWRPGYFKLFISHLAAFKTQASALKDKLEAYGISAFVAHEDIEPTKEWQQEIEKGLFTMDALCAILVPDFNLSKWTDQEIGFALGRSVLVVPIRKGLDPYGLFGKIQGFQADGKTVGQVAVSLFDILAANPKTGPNLSIKLSELFLLSNNTEEALVRISALKRIKNLARERIELLHNRIKENMNLKSSKVLKEFNELTASFGMDEVKASDFERVKAGEDDDLPF